MRVRISHTVIIIITPRRHQEYINHHVAIRMCVVGCGNLWGLRRFDTPGGVVYRIRATVIGWICYCMWVCVEFRYQQGRRCLITSCQTKYWLLLESAVCPEAKSKLIKSTLALA